MVDVKKQVGAQDCGLFAIAVATALVHDTDQSRIQFKQSDM